MIIVQSGMCKICIDTHACIQTYIYTYEYINIHLLGQVQVFRLTQHCFEYFIQ
jgi:hypothetical protein